MYSIIAFILTLGQLAIVLISYALQSSAVFYGAVVYGSPFYLAMTMLQPDSVLREGNLIYISILIFHLLKYFVFFRAQVLDDTNALRTMAIVLEAMYLALSAYYLY